MNENSLDFHFWFNAKGLYFGTSAALTDCELDEDWRESITEVTFTNKLFTGFTFVTKNKS